MLADTLRQMKADGVNARSALSPPRPTVPIPVAGNIARTSPQRRLPRAKARHRWTSCACFTIIRCLWKPTLNRCARRWTGFRKNGGPLHRIAYTAHSIPLGMAESCNYQRQLVEVARLVSSAFGRTADPLVFQSRSGPASQPWLGPDILDHLRTIHAEGATDIVIAPIGFVSDHMEVLYDLDTEAAKLCRDLGLNLQRAATAGTHPKFVRMMRELVHGANDGLAGAGGRWHLSGES